MMYSIFYLPLHVVYKGSSTTTKVQAVFDVSANSMSGVSLNDHLLVGPTVHSSLVDDLLRFRLNRIAVTADVSKMYNTTELMESNHFMLTTDWLELIMSKRQSTSRKSCKVYSLEVDFDCTSGIRVNQLFSSISIQNFEMYKMYS